MFFTYVRIQYFCPWPLEENTVSLGAAIQVWRDRATPTTLKWMSVSWLLATPPNVLSLTVPLRRRSKEWCSNTRYAFKSLTQTHKLYISDMFICKKRNILRLFPDFPRALLGYVFFSGYIYLVRWNNALKFSWGGIVASFSSLVGGCCVVLCRGWLALCRVWLIVCKQLRTQDTRL